MTAHGPRPARPQPAARLRGARRRAPRHPRRGPAGPHPVGGQQRAARACGRAFQDDLFQRTPTGMEPTALARELAAPVAAALDAVRAAVELNRPFEPGTARDEFTIGVSDYAEFVLAPPLVAALRAARARRLGRVPPCRPRGGAGAARRGPGPSGDRHVPRAAGADDPDRAAARRVRGPDARAATRRRAALDLDALSRLAAPPGLAGGEPRGRGRPGAGRRWAAAAGSPPSSRTISSWRRSCRAAPALHHGPAARRAHRGGFGLALLPLPAGLVLAPQPTSLVFHNRYAQRPAHRWLRALIAETARRLVASPVPEHDPSGPA